MLAVAAGAAAVLRGHSSTSKAATTTGQTATAPHVVRTTQRITTQTVLVERSTGTLGSPVQDAAGAPLPGGRAMLLGGLTAGDTSRPDVVIATTRTDHAAGTLPVGLHDTAAVTLGSSVYLFGGGTASNTQSADVLRTSVAGGAVTRVGTLPDPSSDQSAASIGSTAYIVGGYTGSRWLDTIVAWRPGAGARVVAHLPYALRYAAVAAVNGVLVIAGGSLESGAAGNEVLVYRPGTARAIRIGSLPAPTTHAGAAALGSTMYVIGGRGAALATATARIVAIDPATHRIRAGGTLDSPRSDLTAVAQSNQILLAGGRATSGTTAALSVLRPVRRSVSAAPRPTRAPAGLDVYAHDSRNHLTGAARAAKQLVYVPNSQSDSVDVIDPATHKIVQHFATGGLPQHVVPSWDLRTLYVTNDTGNSLTPIDPRTGRPGAQIPVDDPYNMYFTPDGRYAIVVAERLHRLDFRDAHTFKLHHSLVVPCSGVDHMDFTADGRFLLASCEFSGQMLEVSVRDERVVRTITIPHGGAMPQDVKLSPDGRTFYVADMASGGLWEIDASSFRVRHFLPTGAGAHGLYPSRDARYLYVSNRSAGTVSVVSFRTGRIVETWSIPGGSPDMGGVSADGSVLWLSGRYNAEVYAISTRTGHLLARIPVGAGPHGVSVWPQPGRYSLGHTGILR